MMKQMATTSLCYMYPVNVLGIMMTCRNVNQVQSNTNSVNVIDDWWCGSILIDCTNCWCSHLKLIKQPMNMWLLPTHKPVLPEKNRLECCKRTACETHGFLSQRVLKFTFNTIIKWAFSTLVRLIPPLLHYRSIACARFVKIVSWQDSRLRQQ